MKSIRQIHDEEQREAQVLAATDQFVATMQQIERDHYANQESIRQQHRRTLLLITIICALAVLGPAGLILIRYLIR